MRRWLLRAGARDMAYGGEGQMATRRTKAGGPRVGSSGRSAAKPAELQSGYEFFLEVNIIAQLASNLMQRALPHGLTLAQFSVLNWFVRVDSEATPGRLARAFQVTNGAMTNTLQRLLEKALVTVEPDPANGRQKRVRMTALGRRCRDDAIASTYPDIADFLAEFELAEVRSLIPTLRRMREYLDRQRDPAGPATPTPDSGG
jgi:DNA-binding MarR family transcriptional regulator